MKNLVSALILLGACGSPPPPAPPPPPPAPAAAPTPAPAAHAAGAFDPENWTAPDEATIPAGPLGDSIRRGIELFTRTDQLLPDYVGASMSCASCHLDKGRQRDAVPMVGAYARFPKYMERTGAVIAIQDRVNYCFTRSLAGSRIPTDSLEMTDFVNYIAWLSKDVPVGVHIAGEVLPKMEEILVGDPANGEKVFTEKCVACHQADGGGVPGAFPALWGPKSYSIGASMAREERAASFIQHFMPQNEPGTLTAQQAFDLSAYINSKPRPDSPAKENDWPEGGAPADVPYATNGHEAYKPPPLLERAKPELAVVPKPPPLGGK